MKVLYSLISFYILVTVGYFLLISISPITPPPSTSPGKKVRKNLKSGLFDLEFGCLLKDFVSFCSNLREGSGILFVFGRVQIEWDDDAQSMDFE